MELMHIQYRIMQPQDIDAAAECIGNTFTQHEPLTHFLNISKRDFTIYVRHICQLIVGQQLSMVAESDGRIIGVRLAARHQSYKSPVCPCVQMITVAALFAQLHQHAQQYDTQHRLHLIMMGVDEAFHNHGIAQQLMQKTLANARQRGYQLAIVEATSSITQHIFVNKLGFRIVNEIAYKNFRHQQKLVLKNIPEQHPSCALLEKQL